ncbi:hypothetical protein MRX96_057878 [Rhipicephalus microplus]
MQQRSYEHGLDPAKPKAPYRCVLASPKLGQYIREAEREPFSDFGRRYQRLQITRVPEDCSRATSRCPRLQHNSIVFIDLSPTKVDDLRTSRSRPAAGEAVTKQ